MKLRTLAVTGLMAVGIAAPAVAQSTGSSDSGTAQTERAQKPAKKKHRGPKLSDAQLTTVASALGVTVDELKAALAEVRTATAATEARETKAERDALLADALGVEVEDLRAAFADVRPAGGPRGDCPEPGAAPTATPSA